MNFSGKLHDASSERAIVSPAPKSVEGFVLGFGGVSSVHEHNSFLLKRPLLTFS
jgi:hypothetical protein